MLVFVVACEAEPTLRAVLARIPQVVFDEYDAEVLVLDDSSRDRTFEVGMSSAAASSRRFTVLHNGRSPGYGGNQKLGYQYALRNGFDFVVLLRGDGEYAPECIPALLQPLVENRADAVLGSRMRSPLSGFRTGFRAYRVTALGRIPFQYNSDALPFDAEVIVQLMLASCSIVEVPIPADHAAGTRRVDGLRCARDAFFTTLASRLHRMNVLYDRRFDVDGPGNHHYTLKLGYRSSHTMAMEAVPAGARVRVLDIGCGPGTFARLLVGKGCAVSGVDQYPPADRSAFKDFFLWDGHELLVADLRDYDYVLLLDLIEHLANPEAFLDGLRHAARSMNMRPKLIVTTGNVAFGVLRLQMLLGNFNYGKRGILDLTHKRLYTFHTLRRLFEQCGFVVEEVRGVPAPFPEALGLNRASRFLVRVNEWLIRLSKGWFSYQIFMRVAPTPTVDALLDDSIRASRMKAAGLQGRDPRRGTAPQAARAPGA